MGGCASKPNDLNTEKAPAAVEESAPPAKTSDVPPEAPAAPPAEIPAAPGKAGPETIAQEKKDEGETKEKPLVDVSEPAMEAAKVQEATKTETKPEPATGQAIPGEGKPTEANPEVVIEPATPKCEVAEGSLENSNPKM